MLVGVRRPCQRSLTRSLIVPTTPGNSSRLLYELAIRMLRAATSAQSVLVVDLWSAGIPTGYNPVEITTVIEAIRGRKFKAQVHHSSLHERSLTFMTEQLE